MADRMIVMNGGMADQIGAPLEVYSNPATEFVAGFIGSPPTNFLTSGEQRLGVRPEHMRLAAAGEGGLNARAIYSEALGAETLVHLKSADGTQLTVRQDAAAGIPDEGTEVGLAWDASAEMRFDPTGKRI